MCRFIVITGKIYVSFAIYLELGYLESYCCAYMVYRFVWWVRKNMRFEYIQGQYT